MITSMTGFGLAERKNKLFSIEINIRSTNNRFFDSNIKIPSSISSLEKTIYQSCKSHFKRGTIQLYCRIKMNDIKNTKSAISKNKLDDFYNMLLPVEKKFKNSGLRLNLSFDNILNKLTSQEFELNEKNKKLILTTFELAFSDLLKSRKIEGKKIETEIKSNIKILVKINSKLMKLEGKNKKEHFENYKKRIKIVLGQSGYDLDDSKLYRELAVFSDKYDISEETSRINYHIEKFNNHVKKEDYPGKKINFLCQELFREINTIGSKSNNEIISSLVVDFKTNLEKIREQIQNIL
ncbi:MAG: YicC/YloC family endoribonuclease [Candidatus Neomarinimicrobiota bacterium]|tara:strand:+ start:204 stop:1085 length:882 start_codon:yes stop_codon:yes gene_type:complete